MQIKLILEIVAPRGMARLGIGIISVRNLITSQFVFLLEGRKERARVSISVDAEME